MVVRRLVVVTPACCATTATSHPFTRAQVSTTPWPGGSGHTLAIMLIVIHKYKCVPVPLYSLHRSAQDVVTSSSVWCGELRPAWPRGHCHHIFEHFNHSYPAPPPPPPPAPAFSMLQIFTADPSLSSCSCWPEYPVSKLSNSLAIY